MTTRIVMLKYANPTALGDTGAPKGYITLKPTRRRDVDDTVVLPSSFNVKWGAALMDGDTVVRAATPGTAWARCEITDGTWGWTYQERTNAASGGTFLLPAGADDVPLTELEHVDPDTFDPLPSAQPAWEAADEALHTTITGETTTAISDAIDDLVGGAPGTLDTLNEIAAALGDDEAFATTIAAQIAAKVPNTRTVNGHALSADVTVSKGDVGLGNVDNTADINKPVSTQQQAAIDSAVAALINGSPGALDTLNELAEALGDDANFASTMTNALAAKATAADLSTEVTNRTNDVAGLDARVDVLELSTAPGKELGYAERSTSATTTATSAAGAADITTFSVGPIVGKGRPVEVEFYASSITHSTANANVSVFISVNGAVGGSLGQFGGQSSPSTTAGLGDALHISRRVVLTDGVSYTFTVRVFSLTAGTSTVYAAAGLPMSLAVTAR